MDMVLGKPILINQAHGHTARLKEVIKRNLRKNVDYSDFCSAGHIRM